MTTGKGRKRPGKRRSDDDGPTVIRKYPNRRLYNTASGAFVTLEDLRRMVAAGEPFVVEDGKDGKDITSSILAQIIAEQESRGESVLPGDLMRRLIAFYDSGMTESFFQQMQEQMDAFTKTWTPLEAYGEIGKRNMEMMRKSYETFFNAAAPGAKPPPKASPCPDQDTPDNAETRTDSSISETVDGLQKKLEELQAQMEELRKPRRKPDDRD